MTTSVTNGGAMTRVFPNPTPNDIDVVARTLWGEARGEGRDGVMAVAEVIRNRWRAAQAFLRRHPAEKKHPLFGDGTLAGVCKASFQFSCWNSNDVNLPKLLAVTKADWQFVMCLDVADILVTNHLSNSTLGATHYYDKRISPPPWTVGAKFCGAIGHHRFYRDVK